MPKLDDPQNHVPSSAYRNSSATVGQICWHIPSKQ